MSLANQAEATTWDYDGAPEHRKGTCELCGRSRKLARHGRYYWRCRECFPIRTDKELKAARAIAERERDKRSLRARKAYPVIGGPLDGEHATTYDFERGWGSMEPGMYVHLADQYLEYNIASRSRGPSMIFIHVGCLQPVKTGRER